MRAGPGPSSVPNGVRILERGWLSSNSVLFPASSEAPSTVVDTGYELHASMTVSWVERELCGSDLQRVVNSHLHSDHCGGNAALQRRYPDAETWVPEACFDDVSAWDEQRLSYRATDQRCERFSASHMLCPGTGLAMGSRQWEVHGAPGHDPTALMFYEPQDGVLISADALWEKRLAIVFPELVGQPGFDACLDTLDRIERLAPRWVIPGHGSPFSDVAGALRSSRERLEAFARAPERHRRHAIRALVMFRMLELRQVARQELVAWLQRTPITGILCEEEAVDLVDSLLSDSVLVETTKDYLAVSG